MSFFFKNKPFLSFVFDIRDSSISVSAVKFENDKKPEIILCQNFEIQYQDSQDYSKYSSLMIKTLDDSVSSLKKSLIKIGNKEKIKDYRFFIGSPWTVSQSKTIKIIKDRPFEINNALLSKIIVGEELLAEKELETETQLKDWKVMLEKIIQSKINGYKVDNIFGKKTMNLAVEIFVSFIPYEIKNKLSTFISEKIGRHTKEQDNSSILSSYTFFRDMYSNKNDFIYVDIGKIITDIYVVRDDIIFGIASFPFGEEDMIQTSLSKTNLSRDVFMSYLCIGNDKNFDLTSHNNGEDMLKFGFEAWMNKLKDVLPKICTEMNIPNNLFIVPNSVVSEILVKVLSNKEDGKQFELLESKIEITSIVEGVFDSLILNGKAFPNEPHIKMDVIFLDKMLKL
jgi:hypothetical protein